MFWEGKIPSTFKTSGVFFGGVKKDAKFAPKVCFFAVFWGVLGWNFPESFKTSGWFFECQNLGVFFCKKSGFFVKKGGVLGVKNTFVWLKTGFFTF